MCEFAFDDKLLIKHAESLNTIFVHYLGEQEAQIRVAALKAMTSFLASIEDSSILAKFSAAIPTLVEKAV